MTKPWSSRLLVLMTMRLLPHLFNVLEAVEVTAKVRMMKGTKRFKILGERHRHQMVDGPPTLQIEKQGA